MKPETAAFRASFAQAAATAALADVVRSWRTMHRLLSESGPQQWLNCSITIETPAVCCRDHESLLWPWRVQHVRMGHVLLRVRAGGCWQRGPGAGRAAHGGLARRARQAADSVRIRQCARVCVWLPRRPTGLLLPWPSRQAMLGTAAGDRVCKDGGCGCNVLRRVERPGECARADAAAGSGRRGGRRCGKRSWRCAPPSPATRPPSGAPSRCCLMSMQDITVYVHASKDALRYFSI